MESAFVGSFGPCGRTFRKSRAAAFRTARRCSYGLVPARSRQLVGMVADGESGAEDAMEQPAASASTTPSPATQAAPPTSATTSPPPPPPPVMPTKQGGVPVQSGAQADLKAVQSVDNKTSNGGYTIPTEEEIIRRRRTSKKVTRAAAIQESQGFADAWSQNNRRYDVWFFIGLVFLVTPFAFLAWGVSTGIIPLE